jgi:alkaline phosphatase
MSLSKLSRRRFLTAAGAALAAPAFLRATSALAQTGGPARNVILMISDGAGFHTWTAASYFRHGALGQEVYDRFPVRTLMTTYPLTTAREPTMDMAPQVSYDPAQAWAKAPVEGSFEGEVTKLTYPKLFAGYDYVRQNYVDSAAAGTALSAGIKTYNNAINWTNDDKPARMMGEIAKSAGRAVGVVTSVQISHATPASFLAHNRSRNDYAGIGAEIVEAGIGDIVLGAGHPMFDKAGAYRTPSDKNFQYVGGAETWMKLISGETGYHFLDARADFEALAAGTLAAGKDKILGLARVDSTLQFQRPGKGMGGMIADVPSLETMTKGALNFLAAKENGFFLMVEGGAVDWAAHANDTARIIEEQIDFNRSVEAVVAWIEANGGFENTLLIVTTDHGNGMIYGPESDRFAFQPVVNRGRGNLPEVRWHYDTHTNELVPVWAAGPGASLIAEAATGQDDGAALVGWGDVARYHDNTDLARVMSIAMGASI